jgi:hypothetical protein
VLNFSPLEAGVRFLPITVLSFFVAPVAGQLLNRIQARVFFGVGLGCVGVGLLLMRGVSVDSTWTTLLPGFLIAGAGIGMTNPAIAAVAVGVVPAAKAGMGSGINNTFRQVGIATGVAGLGAIFESSIQSRLSDHLQQVPDGLSQAVASAGPRAASSAGPQAVDAARAAFIASFNEILLIAGILTLAGAVLGLLLTRPKDLLPHEAPAQVLGKAEEPVPA